MPDVVILGPEAVDVVVPPPAAIDVYSGTGSPGPPGPPGADGPPGPPGAAGGLSTRQTTSFTTASLAPGASGTGTVALATGYRLLRITCSAASRVRLYTTDAKRTADAARPIGTDPTGDHGLILEFVATASLLAADLSPTVDGFDGKTTPDGAIPWTATNTGAGAAAVTVDLAWIRTE